MFARAATVLIAGLHLADVSAFAQPSVILFENVRIFDGKGMPVLIDMHWHAMFVRPTPAAVLAGDVGHLNLMAAPRLRTR